jgi:FixJ family two-component response regulator
MIVPGFSGIGFAYMDQYWRPMRCVIVDSDVAVRAVIRLALADCEVVAERFARQSDVISACDRSVTDILFLEPDLCGFDPVEVLSALAAAGFRGAVQLVSGSHALLDQIRRAGERRGLNMLPPLRKPFRASDIQRVVENCRNGALVACEA